jgi:hypothetical protein
MEDTQHIVSSESNLNEKLQSKQFWNIQSIPPTPNQENSIFTYHTHCKYKQSLTIFLEIKAIVIQHIVQKQIFK